jgi:hypothetical protein
VICPGSAVEWLPGPIWETTTDTYELLPIPGKLRVDMFISRKEEWWMGIDEQDTLEYRDENGLLGSDIEEIKHEIAKKTGESGNITSSRANG